MWLSIRDKSKIMTTNDELEVLGEREPHHSEHAFKGVFRIIDPKYCKIKRRRAIDLEKDSTQRRYLACLGNASILGWVSAPIMRLVGKASYKKN